MFVARGEGGETGGRNSLVVGEKKMCGGRECGRGRDESQTVVVVVVVGVG